MLLPNCISQDCKANCVQNTDYGRPMKPFFTEIQNFWAWADKWDR